MQLLANIMADFVATAPALPFLLCVSSVHRAVSNIGQPCSYTPTPYQLIMLQARCKECKLRLLIQPATRIHSATPASQHVDGGKSEGRCNSICNTQQRLHLEAKRGAAYLASWQTPSSLSPGAPPSVGTGRGESKWCASTLPQQGGGRGKLLGSYGGADERCRGERPMEGASLSGICLEGCVTACTWWMRLWSNGSGCSPVTMTQL
jgi:hypothetical protein